MGLADSGRSRIHSAGSEAAVTTSIAVGADARPAGAVRAQWPAVEHCWKEQCEHSCDPTVASEVTRTPEPCWCAGGLGTLDSAVEEHGCRVLITPLATGTSQLLPRNAESRRVTLELAEIAMRLSIPPPPIICQRPQ